MFVSTHTGTEAEQFISSIGRGFCPQCHKSRFVQRLPNPSPAKKMASGSVVALPLAIQKGWVGGKRDFCEALSLRGHKSIPVEPWYN